jgi:hypothetical protein
MRQQDTADTDGDGVVSFDTDDLNWCDALACRENPSLAGHNDWRLPSVRELQTIVDYGRYNLAIDPVFRVFPSVYWTSTSHAEATVDAWFIVFVDGHVLDIGKDSVLQVRAVRSGP